MKYLVDTHILLWAFIKTEHLSNTVSGILLDEDKETENMDLITSYKLPIYHKDPFDRFLIWEAI
jgi:PIN domain nuclease of toxin-antitoxin system